MTAAADPAARAAAHTLQSALLPACAHLTAASPLIAAQYAARYGVTPRVVLNVFPRAHAPAALVQPGPWTAERPLRVYWFSQTVGPGRGLEEVIAILARLPGSAELQLRGVVAPDYATRLQALAHAAGLARPVVFLPPGPAADMARLAADADLGLSTEVPPPLNRDLCLTNKIFVYLLAGLPQLLSHTAAQTALAPQLGDAALLCDLADPAATAARIAAHFQDPARAAAARRHAWQLAQERFCWDLEQAALLDSVARVLA